MWLSRNLPYGDIYNSTHIMLTAYHTWELVYIKDDLEGKVIFTNYDEIYNYLLNYLIQINATELHLDNYYYEIEVNNMVVWINYQVKLHICALNLSEENLAYHN